MEITVFKSVSSRMTYKNRIATIVYFIQKRGRRLGLTYKEPLRVESQRLTLTTMADAQKYTNKLANARVLIIGGTSGIGFCVAEACLEAGCHVTISSSQPTRITSSISRLLTSYPSAKSRLTGHACDLASPDVEANIESLFSKLGTLDHIVFTAGDKLSTTPLSDVTLANIHQFNQVRHFAPLLVAKHALAHFAPGPSSSFTLTTGTASERPVPGWVNPAAFTAARARWR